MASEMLEHVKFVVWFLRICVGACFLDLYRISVENVPSLQGKTPEELWLEAELRRRDDELKELRRLYHPLVSGMVGMAKPKR